jgi:hypothetical protein
MRLLFSNQKIDQNTATKREAIYMPINLFNMLIAFGNMTRANSYWWEKRRQNDCNAAISPVVEISDLPKCEQGWADS